MRSSDIYNKKNSVQSVYVEHMCCFCIEITDESGRMCSPQTYVTFPYV